jgi:copper resistance protein D
MTAVFAFVRAIHFASLMAVFGAGLFLVLLRRHHLIEMSARAARVLFSGASSMALLSAIAWLVLVTGQMSGDWHAALDPSAIKAVAADTEFGRIAVARIAGLVVLWLLCILQRPSPGSVVVFFAACILGTLGLTSHAAASTGGFAFVRAANDAVHLLAAGFWLGGLIVLAVLLVRFYREPSTLRGPFQLFSAWGSYAVALLVLSGITNAAVILPVKWTSAHSAYAHLLEVKITLALGMIALAVINRMQLVPALRDGEYGITWFLGQSVRAEILLGALVVGIAGYLGLMPPR